MGKERAMGQLVEYLVEHPEVSLGQMGQAIGKGRSTVHRYLAELEGTGRVSKLNGAGWQVVG